MTVSVTDSILQSTKKVLGLDSAYDAFDIDIIMHVNTAFATLNQLGIGPDDGYAIADETAVWDDFLGGDGNKLKLNNVKTYVYLRLRSLFDPPDNRFVQQALQEQLRELEWRMNTVREMTDYIDPVTHMALPDQPDRIFDGGKP